jgi:NAD-dependent DNA ligase
MEDLVARITEAQYAYHNGLPETMTDAEYDAAIDALEEAAPGHPLLKKVGAALPAALAAEEVELPIPLPSLNKAKPGTLAKWLAKCPAAAYHVSTKLDGCSALWLPESRKLYTRGDGVRGRDISTFVPYMKGLPLLPLLPAAASGGAGSGSGPAPQKIGAVRGELIMRTDSPAVPPGKLARNIVAGALNRKEPDPALFAEIRFVAYELVYPSTVVPSQAYREMRLAGLEVARSVVIPAAEMSEAKLSDVFGKAEASSPFQLDGMVVAPDLARPEKTIAAVAAAENPGDRVAWKTRPAGLQLTQRTTVIAVEWNISSGGYLIPRVLFEPVLLAGARIAAATGLHGRWIYDNRIGPGAEIEIRRAGDTIPQIVAVHKSGVAGPAMPPAFQWMGPADSAVHIGPVAGNLSMAADEAKIKLTHGLSELGAENVGPGIVAKLYDAGFTTMGAIYRATLADLEARVGKEGGKMASRIYEGLRAGTPTWSTLKFLVASYTMPRGVGHSKLTPLLALEPNVAAWTQARLSPRPAGLSDKTIEAIVASVPTYLAWLAETGFDVEELTAGAPAPAVAAAAAMTVVFTGARDKALEAALAAKGHTVAASVTKKTTHVVYPDGPPPTSSKITAAQAAGIPIFPLSAFRLLLA